MPTQGELSQLRSPTLFHIRGLSISQLRLSVSKAIARHRLVFPPCLRCANSQSTFLEKRNQKPIVGAGISTAGWGSPSSDSKYRLREQHGSKSRFVPSSSFPSHAAPHSFYSAPKLARRVIAGLAKLHPANPLPHCTSHPPTPSRLGWCPISLFSNSIIPQSTSWWRAPTASCWRPHCVRA